MLLVRSSAAKPVGLEGQQLKNDVFSIFHDGSLDVDNPN
jgi:hypothetical protein